MDPRVLRLAALQKMENRKHCLISCNQMSSSVQDIGRCWGHAATNGHNLAWNTFDRYLLRTLACCDCSYSVYSKTEIPVTISSGIDLSEQGPWIRERKVQVQGRTQRTHNTGIDNYSTPPTWPTTTLLRSSSGTSEPGDTYQLAACTTELRIRIHMQLILVKQHFIIKPST